MRRFTLARAYIELRLVVRVRHDMEFLHLLAIDAFEGSRGLAVEGKAALAPRAPPVESHSIIEAADAIQGRRRQLAEVIQVRDVLHRGTHGKNCGDRGEGEEPDDTGECRHSHIVNLYERVRLRAATMRQQLRGNFKVSWISQGSSPTQGEKSTWIPNRRFAMPCCWARSP